MDQTIAARFWAMVQKLPGEDACWTWTGCISNRGGYGKFSIANRSVQAHRIAWLLFRDEQLVPGNCVCHHCDNPRCVRPDHLFQGTIADNNRDMIAKGRLVRGEVRSQSKLTNVQVEQVREKLGRMSQSAIAREYGVDKSTISKIKRGIRWNHV